MEEPRRPDTPPLFKRIVNKYRYNLGNVEERRDRLDGFRSLWEGTLKHSSLLHGLPLFFFKGDEDIAWITLADFSKFLKKSRHAVCNRILRLIEEEIINPNQTRLCYEQDEVEYIRSITNHFQDMTRLRNQNKSVRVLDEDLVQWYLYCYNV